MDADAKCQLCGEPMPPGETMFNYHGYSGPCPNPPLPKPTRLVINVPYRVTEMTVNPQRYGEPTALLKRDDGIAGGRLQIGGPGVDELTVDSIVKITVEPAK